MSMKFTPQMLSKLKSDYSKVKMMSVVTPEYKKLKSLIQSLPDSEKQKLIDADIKWLKTIAQMTMKESSTKQDFLKAIGGHKPTEVYRVHADIGDGKVGITGWYTKAVIDDVVDDIKKKGVKIIKIEKSTDPKNLKERKLKYK